MENNVNRPDFLKECMSDVGQTPLDIFQKSYCFVCGNRECSRSSANNLQFDRRVLNWKKDLFDEVPRADEFDQRFAQIRSKQFLPANQSPAVITPRFQEIAPVFKETIPEVVQTDPILDQVSPENSTQPMVDMIEISTIDPPVPVDTPKPVQPIVQPTQGKSNTPFSQGTTLPGFRKEEPKDVVIDVGGSFTFGGNNES
jgi:hypothetical protein